jgi:hypothetical protein
MPNRLRNPVRLLLACLVAAAVAGVVACGGGDDPPTPVPTTSISSQDEQAMDQAIAAVIAALQQRTTTALDSLANDRLKARVASLDPLATCFPADGALAVRTRLLKPGSGNDVRATINFTVTENGETSTVARDWRFERQADGSFELTDAPGCPFKKVTPSTDVTGTPAPTEEELTAPTDTPSPTDESSAPTDTEAAQ